MIKNNIDVVGLSDLIQKTLSEKESFYVFEKGNFAKFLENKNVVDLKTFNFFSLYHPKAFNSFIAVKSMLSQICLELDVNAKASKFYISSEYFNDKVISDFTYDFGGVKIPCFSGVISLQKNDFRIYFKDKEVSLRQGDILVFEAGQEVKFDDIEIECIYFYIAPLFMLERQYPQKWIPIGD